MNGLCHSSASVAYLDGVDDGAYLVRFTRSANVERYPSLEAAEDAVIDANTCDECGALHNDVDAAS